MVKYAAVLGLLWSLVADTPAHACAAEHAEFVPPHNSVDVPTNQHMLVNAGVGCHITDGVVNVFRVLETQAIALPVTVRHWGSSPDDAHLIEVIGPNGVWPPSSKIQMVVMVLPVGDPGKTVEFTTGAGPLLPRPPTVTLDEGHREADASLGGYRYSITGTSDAVAWAVTDPDGVLAGFSVPWPPAGGPAQSIALFRSETPPRTPGCFIAHVLDPLGGPEIRSNTLCVDDAMDAPPATFPAERGCVQAGVGPILLVVALGVFRRARRARF
jgi:hypothetical protein